MLADFSASFSLAAPEVIVALGAVILLMVGVYSKEGAFKLVTWLSLAVLALAAWFVVQGGQGTAFGSGYTSDFFAVFMKMLVLTGAFFTLWMSMPFAEQDKLDKFEFPILVMLSTLGMMLMVSANNMLALIWGWNFSRWRFTWSPRSTART